MFQNTTLNTIIVLHHYLCHLITKVYNQTFSCMSPESCLLFSLRSCKLLKTYRKVYLFFWLLIMFDDKNV